MVVTGTSKPLTYICSQSACMCVCIGWRSLWSCGYEIHFQLLGFEFYHDEKNVGQVTSTMALCQQILCEWIWLMIKIVWRTVWMFKYMWEQLEIVKSEAKTYIVKETMEWPLKDRTNGKSTLLIIFYFGPNPYKIWKNSAAPSIIYTLVLHSQEKCTTHKEYFLT